MKLQACGPGAAASWEIEIDCDATVSAAVRDDVMVDATTVNDTLPLPVWLSLLTCSQSTWLDAVHAHALVVVTVAVPVPPLAPKVVAGVDTLKLQDGETGVGVLPFELLPHAGRPMQTPIRTRRAAVRGDMGGDSTVLGS
jgi:hypothetical protein